MAQMQMRLAGTGKRALPTKTTFTVAALQTIKTPAKGKLTWIYDDKTPGLALLTTPNRAQTFYLYRKIDGRPERIRLGGFPDIAIDQARKLAQRHNGQIADGINPQEQKRIARAAMTFGELFTWYIENHSKPHKRTWLEDQQKYELHLKAPLGARQYTTVTRADIAKLHIKIGETSPGAANRNLALISSVFEKARTIGFDGINPAKGIQRFPEHQRTRFVQSDEFPRLFPAIKAEGEFWEDFFLTCLWTGARKGNVQSMSEDELNLDAAIWTIPAGKFKNKDAVIISLSPQAVVILRRRLKNLPPSADGAPRYVFPGERGGHLKSPRQAWERICKAANVSDLRIHDLRRTLGSWQAADGASLQIIGKSLGHNCHVGWESRATRLANGYLSRWIATRMGGRDQTPRANTAPLRTRSLRRRFPPIRPPNKRPQTTNFPDSVPNRASGTLL